MADHPLINPQGEYKENLSVNQIQSQDQNQIYMNHPLQNNTTPDQTYNSTDFIDKPQNPVSQPTYPPQNVNAPMAQPVYPQPQGVALPVQQGLPVNNYPPQIQYPNDMPYYVQPVSPENQTQNQNYKNFSEIPHKGIFQVNENTFHITTGCCFKIFPFFIFFAGVGVGANYFFNPESNFFLLIFGAIIASIGLIMFFKLNNDIYFIVGPNSLTIVKKAICLKKAKIYNPGELVGIYFKYSYGRGSKGGHTHSYNLKVLLTNGKQETIFSFVSNSTVFTLDEMGYFRDYINNHIQTKMRV